MKIRVDPADIGDDFKGASIGQNNIQNQVSEFLFDQFTHQLMTGSHFLYIGKPQVKLDMQLESFTDHAVIISNDNSRLLEWRSYGCGLIQKAIFH